MRVKRQKRHRKSVRFYTACFGFREPFKVLCDGTFVHHLLINRITTSNDALSNLLGAPAKLFTTRCVLGELKSLGESYAESLQVACNLATARCDHDKRRKSAVECITEVIGEKNTEHFFVATQDTDLRNKFQKISGVPVIFGLRNSLILEPPSAFQRQYAKSTEEERLHMTESEYKMLQKKEKKELANQEANDSFDAHEGLGDQIVMARAVTKINSAKRTMGVMDKAQFKRKKAKGPNPLSCKKKKSHVNPSLLQNQDGKEGDNTSRKRNRKRKSHKGIKPAEANASRLLLRTAHKSYVLVWLMVVYGAAGLGRWKAWSLCAVSLLCDRVVLFLFFVTALEGMASIEGMIPVPSIPFVHPHGLTISASL
ncbi:hypothetical protein HHK36_030365 [Tetracentron sinense]|uniref:UTP23 sensor motif region domain-containing protein n=1 Tax=Tetracentron sinense TaxID=13715 RepID=A0A835D1H5_TETSI|nr:hypothetical protein HHK36_030365 [Tetracentron sinense]